MISKVNQEKVKKFFTVVSVMQNVRQRVIGLLVLKKENLSDIAALAPNSNLVTSIELSSEIAAEDVVEQMADAMRTGRIALMRLHEYLDPKIYNQLFLLSQDGHMEYPHLEERIFVDAKDNAHVLLLSTDAELEKCNYSNLLDLVGIVERL